MSKLATKAKRAELNTPAAKPRRWKKRTCAERQCRHIQKESDFVHIVKGAPYGRLIRSVVAEVRPDMRMTSEFLFASREVVEDMEQTVLVDSRRLCQKEKREVVQDRDVQAAMYGFCKGNTMMQGIFSSYLKMREKLGLEPGLSIPTAESEANWMYERQKIYEENRKASAGAKKPKSKASVGKKRKAPSGAESSAKKPKTASADSGVEKGEEKEDEEETPVSTPMDTEAVAEPEAEPAAEEEDSGLSTESAEAGGASD
jgi:histone H3/H4